MGFYIFYLENFLSRSLDTVKYIHSQAHDFNGTYSSLGRYLWNSVRFFLIFALLCVTSLQRRGGSSLIGLIFLGVEIITVISDLAEIQGLHGSAILSRQF